MSGWLTKPVFYFVTGILFMAPVLWIARTPLFYTCYFPLIIAAIVFSGKWNPKIKIPSGFWRVILFSAGMIICEFSFSLLLVVRNELTFRFQENRSDWTILAVELILGILVFVLFFCISAGVRYFLRKIK